MTIKILFNFFAVISILLLPSSSNNKICDESYNSNFDQQDIKAYLMNKEQFIEGAETNVKFKYTNDKEIIILDGEELLPGIPYYLSHISCNDTSFDETKIGSATNGLYYFSKNYRGLIKIINDKKFIVYNMTREISAVTYYRK